MAGCVFQAQEDHELNAAQGIWNKLVGDGVFQLWLSDAALCRLCIWVSRPSSSKFEHVYCVMYWHYIKNDRSLSL